MIYFPCFGSLLACQLFVFQKNSLKQFFTAMYTDNKVALVTGGASGIGLAITREFLKHGIRGVTIADINTEQGNKIRAELNQEFGFGKVIFVKTDVSDKEQFEVAMKKTIEAFKNFDILVNSAGLFNDNLYEKAIFVNVNGTVNGCLLAMDCYISQHKTSSEGLILNVASILGLDSLPIAPVYVATKHAIVGLTKALSAAVHYDATKVKIVTICPGFTDTPLMRNLECKFINDRYYHASLAILNHPSFVLQSADELGKAIIPVINQAENGTFWIIDKGTASSVRLPKYTELETLVTLTF